MRGGMGCFWTFMYGICRWVGLGESRMGTVGRGWEGLC